jgi:hypothetical protein
MIEFAFEYAALSGWLITCGALLLFLAWLYKKSTNSGD